MSTVVKPIELRSADFKRKVNEYTRFPESMRNEFFDYWTEPNKSGSKMRFELEKTWDTARRLGTWDRNNFGNKKDHKVNGPVAHPVPVVKEPANEIEELDRILEAYCRHPTSFTLSQLGETIAYMVIKKYRFWPPEMNLKEMGAIAALYQNDVHKCRGYVVQRTFEYYGNKCWNFSKTLEVRNKLLV